MIANSKCVERLQACCPTAVGHRRSIPIAAASRAPAKPQQQHVVTELRGDGTSIKYTLGSRVVRESFKVGGRLGGSTSFVSKLASFYLPDGYPTTVTPDYLRYQLWTLPAHITGWLSHTLTTSSLLKAVGFDVGPVGATAATAAIKWVVKDGIGAAGRFIVGGKLGRELDDDPRRWRMVSEAVSSVGLALEVATAVAPQLFLVLASTGNFAIAVSKGIGKPVFRVIQTHFAINDNVGAVAAKEEVWEVTGQLLGYATSLVVLNLLQGVGSVESVVGVWLLVQGCHVLLRYQALKQLQFAGLSHKRALALVKAHVAGLSLPSVEAGNAAEPLVPDAGELQPRVAFGGSMDDALASAHLGAERLRALVDAYAGEEFVLVWEEGGHGRVLLKEGCTPDAALRALWLAAWRERHAGMAASGSSVDREAEGLGQLRARFADFLLQAQQAGWNTGQVTIRLGLTRIRVEP